MAPQEHRRRPRVCLVGTAPPRRCGIATFTDDLRTALSGLEPPTPAVQLALTDSGADYEYGADVVFQIQASQLSDYRVAAEFIEHAEVDVVCVQHEFGIFGGPAGRHLTELLDHLQVPVVTTLHTVLADPPPEQLDALRAVAHRSDVLVVLADQAVELLASGYGMRGDKVVVIPHGVPDVPFLDPNASKAAIGAEGRHVLMTFGLLGPDKGIEDVIDALPAVVAAHPDLLYIVLGSTHPEVRRHHGEAYRQSLLDQVARLGLGDHVVFHDRYVELAELTRFLGATDLYITPYRSAEQIVSGTLAYAVGMGCGVVSTPYRYAKELLADGRGCLVPFGDRDRLSEVLVELLGDQPRRDRMRRAAYDYGRQMTWPAVARSYTEVLTAAVAGHERRPKPWRPGPLPAPNLAFLRALTDDTGLFQHTTNGVPNRAEGYCTDDVGRALAAATLALTRRDDADASSLVPLYLSFLQSAQRDDGRFENLLGYDRHFLPGTDSEDTLGQALWGLGTVVACSPDDGWRSLAVRLVDRALPALAGLAWTRGRAYAIAGLCGYLERYPGALTVRRVVEALAGRLEASLAENRRPGWDWYDAELTYANAKIPHAMLLAGRACDVERWTAIGLETLDFLLDATFVDGRFDFVGNEGWYPRGGPRATYGQQPIEAGYTAEACMVAYEVTGEVRYLTLARAAVEWFVGRNRFGLALYDPATGRCADGLDRHGLSRNSGAESVVSALLGLLAVPSPDVPDRAPVRRSSASAAD